jgi:hypothetical protein
MKLKHTISKWNRLAYASIFLVILASVFLCQLNVQVGAAPETFGGIFDVVPDPPLLTSLPSSGTPVFLTGKVYPFRTVDQALCTPLPANTTSLGTWRAWGQVADNGRLVLNQSLALDGPNGVVEIQGPTGIRLALGDALPAVAGTTGAPFTGPSEVLSVTGGVGTFKGASGEAQIRPYCQSQADTLRFFRYDRPFCISFEQ